MIISVKEARDKILAEVFEVYVKCLFLEKYYSNLMYYIFSPYGEYTVEYYYNKIINQIEPFNLEKFRNILQPGEFDIICKRSIEELLTLVTDRFQNAEKNKIKFINTLKILPCPISANSTTEQEESVFTDIKNVNYYFYLEYYLRVAENNSNINSEKRKDVVNVDHLLSIPSLDTVFSEYTDIRYGLRLLYKQNNTDNGDTNGINLKEKAFNIKLRGRDSICTIPIIQKETENISKRTLQQFKADIQYGRPPEQQKYVKILKEQIINSDEYNKVFLKIFPIDMIDLMLASKFYISSKLFQKILNEKNVYKNSSNVVLRLINTLVDYKEIHLE
jgi:hypothetical protein